MHTGKTLAFLIPVIQHLVTSGASPRSMHTLIISPTRELAQQIGDETVKLITYHAGITCTVVVGGTNINTGM